MIIFLVKLPPLAKSETRSFRESLAKIDLLGTAVLMPWMICLLLALEWGGAIYAWSNWRIILCLCLFGVLFPLWICIQYVQGDKGTLPLRIAKQRSVASGMLFMLGGSGSLFVIVYYVPIWFQAVKDVTAEQSGINFLASAGPMTLAAVFSGILVSKCDPMFPCRPALKRTSSGKQKRLLRASNVLQLHYYFYRWWADLPI